MLNSVFGRSIVNVLFVVLIGCGFNSPPQYVGAATQTAPTSTVQKPNPSSAVPVPAPGIPSTSLEANETPTNPSSPTLIYLPTVIATHEVNRSKATDFYVSPNGTPNGDGSPERPWDLQTALENPPSVKPGSIIWVRGGTYGKGGVTIFNSKLVGEPGNPITVRAYPNERPIIDGTFMIYREWAVFWGLEVYSSDPNRLSSIEGSRPSDISRSAGINVLAPNTKFINNIVHDESEGITFSKLALNSELYGNIVYNNGWKGPDRGHGYSIYAQNEEGTKLIRDNITFNNFGEYNIHVYGESISLFGFQFEGNVSFNGKFLIGGLQPSGRITLIDNYFYRNQAQFGYRNQDNRDITLKNNYFGSQGRDSLVIKWWQDLNVIGNRFWNDSAKNVSLTYPNSKGTYQWDNNAYHSPGINAFALDDAQVSWDQWKKTTGYDANSSFTTGQPSGVNVFVRPNAYEPNRANIVIYNWDKNGSVQVDISSVGLRIGQQYILHNPQNYFDETIEGTYTGSPINIPMTGWSIVKPVGWSEPLQPTTFPEFGVFVLIGK